jgi:carbon monoxide dehydrogenase subunit G
MARHEVSVDVGVPPAGVLSALADPASLARLDPGVRSVEAVGDPTVRTGLRTRAVHAFYGRDVVLDHELVGLAETSLERRGTSRRVTMLERVTAEPTTAGTRVTVAVEVRLRGLLRPLDGGLTAVVEQRLARIAEALASLPVA